MRAFDLQQGNFLQQNLLYPARKIASVFHRMADFLT
jgi:hypothetical protein